jgi:hypothetical protein
MTGLANSVKRLAQEISQSFRGIGAPALTIINNLTSRLLDIFRNGFDDLVESATSAGTEVVGKIEKVETASAGVSAVIAAGGQGRERLDDVRRQRHAVDAEQNDRRKSDKIAITLNQNGWTFPAAVDEAGRVALRTIAREEAYAGIVAALEPLTTKATKPNFNARAT